MKKILLLTLLSIFFENANAQQAVAVMGTKFSLIPPEGFTNASNFSGFQNTENGASIMITELAASYFIMNTAFTPEELATEGVTLKSKEKVDFHGNEAYYFTLSQQVNGATYLKQVLMFGDETKTVIVNGIYPEKFSSLGSEIKTSLFSIVYNEKQDDNPFDAVKFSIDPNETDYTFVKYLSGTLVYTEDGNFPSTKSIFMISSLAGKFPESIHKKYAIERLKKLPNGEHSKIKEVNPVTISNLNGFEIIADGQNNKAESELVYQVMLYSKAEYYIMVGQAPNDQPKNLEQFKKLAKTFKVK